MEDVVKRAMKVLGYVVALLLVLVLVFAVLAKMLITPDRVKSTVLPIAEKKLNRQVQLGDVKVSIFSGIVLKDLVVMEKGGKEPFVKARQVRLKYQFWPLLSKRVVVDQILLDAPIISIIRMPDGSFNYSDITARKEPAATEAKPEGKKELNLLVSQVSLTKGEVTFEDRQADPSRPFTYKVGDVEISSNDISLDKPFSFMAKARITGASVEMNGKVADAGKKPSIDAVIKIADADVRKMICPFPPNLTVKTKAFDPSGVVNVRLHLAGPVSAPKELLKEGEIRLSKIQITASGQRPALEGVLFLKGDTVSSKDLTLTMGQNKMEITMTVANLLGKPLSVTSAVKADRFDLQPFLKPKPATVGAVEKDTPEPGPLKLPVRANGTVQLGQTTYKGLPISQLFLKYRLTDNILVIDELKGNVAGGSFSDTARVDLGQKGFIYSTKLTINGVQADPIVSAFVPKAAGTVFGALSLNAEMDGKGTKPPTLKKNVGGKGNFAITQGKLTGAGLVQGLAQFINVEQLRVLQFNKFAGEFRIVDGKVSIDSSISGRDLQITPKGTAGLDSSLDLSLETRLAPQLTARSREVQIGKLLPMKKDGKSSCLR